MSDKRKLWRLYLTAKTLGQRPSDLIGIEDRWAALQFDNAVVMVGTVVESAAQELHNVGSEDRPKMEPKYTLAQLLDPAFKLTGGNEPIDPVSLRGVEGVQFDEVG